MIHKISIIGGGEIGRAIAFIANQANIDYAIWDKDILLSSEPDFNKCLQETSAVFFCIPSSSLRASLNQLALFIPPNIPIVFLSKGIETDTFFIAPEIAMEFIEKKRIVFMGGPMIAEDIVLNKGGGAVLGGDKEMTTLISKVFSSASNIITQYEDDAFSVAILGVLKNIYTILIGLAFGSRVGDNIMAYLMTESIIEMNTISSALGGKISSFTLAGAGDFIATSMSSNSNNRKAGLNLALGSFMGTQSEGVTSINSLILKMSSKNIPIPRLLNFIFDAIQKKEVKEYDWLKSLND